MFVYGNRRLSVAFTSDAVFNILLFYCGTLPALYAADQRRIMFLQTF